MSRSDFDEINERARLAREMLNTDSLRSAIIQAAMARHQSQNVMANLAEITLPATKIIGDLQAQRKAILDSINFTALHELVRQQQSQWQVLARDIVAPAREVQLAHLRFLRRTQEMAEALQLGRQAVTAELLRDWTSATSEALAATDSYEHVIEADDAEQGSYQIELSQSQVTVLFIVAVAVFMLTPYQSDLSPKEREAAEKVAQILIALLSPFIIRIRW